MNKKRTTFKVNQFKKGKVDFENRVIYDVVLIEPDREASGHGMYVDQKMVDQVVEFGKAGPAVGFKAKFDHPSECFSSMGSQLGRLKNFRSNDSGQAIADLHVGSYTEDAPGGDMGKWLLRVADEDPDQVGFSIVFRAAESVTFTAGDDENPDDPKFLYPHARIGEFYGADVVEEGAATSSLFQEETMLNNPEVITEKIESYFNSKPQLLAKLMPLLTKLQENNNNNINTNSNKMSETKENVLFNKLKGILKSFSSDEAVAELEVKTELSAEAIELAAAKEEIEALKSANKESDVRFSEDKEANKVALEALVAEVKELGSKSVSDTAEPTATTDDSVELSDADKLSSEQKTSEEQVAFWASEQAKGNKVSHTYTNQNK